MQALLSFALDRDQWSALIRREVPRYPLDVRLDDPHCQIECADEENSRLFEWESVWPNGVFLRLLLKI